MLFFDERKKLDKKYKEWVETSKELKDCSFNVISFLQLNDLLNVDEVKEFLKQG